MNFFYCGIAILLLIASVFILWPSYKTRKFLVGISLIAILSIVSITVSVYTGQSKRVIKIQEAKQTQRLAQEMFRDPQKLITAMKQRLTQTPNSAKGWYLLARIYESQGNKTAALDAYQHVHKLEQKPG